MATEKFKCHCGDWRFKNAFFVVDETREKVCRDLGFYGEFDGKAYCVLHYPSKEKAEDFKPVFAERLKEERWNFTMIYFPFRLTYEHETFLKEADFSHAIFSDGVEFRDCKFENGFTFFDTIFEEDSSFGLSNFHGQINFNAADFREIAHFYGTTFHPESWPAFSGTKFKIASFPDAKFLKGTHSSAELKFDRARFEEKVDFSQAEFHNKVSFNGALFPEKGKTEFHYTTFHESANFGDVTFFNVNFGKARFCDRNENFAKTTFINCVFRKSASFVGASIKQTTEFERAQFDNVHFEDAVFTGRSSFREARFSEDVFFNGTKFGYRGEGRIASANVGFEGAEFGEKSRVFFDNTWFSYHVNFDYAQFGGFLFFSGTTDNPVFDDVFESGAFWSQLRVLNTTISKPENVYFRTVRLRPAWFVSNVFDVRKVNLIDITWGDGSPISMQKELEIVRLRSTHNASRLLGVAFRQLADNAEANSRFDEASNFRRLAFEAERLVKKERLDRWWNRQFTTWEFIQNFWSQIRVAPVDPAFSLYRITSTFGEGSLRAFLWLLAFVLGSALLYLSPLCDFSAEVGTQALNLSEAIAYSLRVMILQRPEPLPINSFAKIVLATESIIAPLQLALLALALRRKFIR